MRILALVREPNDVCRFLQSLVEATDAPERALARGRRARLNGGPIAIDIDIPYACFIINNQLETAWTAF